MPSPAASCEAGHARVCPDVRTSVVARTLVAALPAAPAPKGWSLLELWGPLGSSGWSSWSSHLAAVQEVPVKVNRLGIHLDSKLVSRQDRCAKPDG